MRNHLALGLDIGRGNAGVGSLVGIDLRLEVGGAFHERGGKRRIRRELCEPQQRGRLSREIRPTQHDDAPQWTPGTCITREQAISFRPLSLKLHTLSGSASRRTQPVSPVPRPQCSALRNRVFDSTRRHARARPPGRAFSHVHRSGVAHGPFAGGNSVHGRRTTELGYLTRGFRISQAREKRTNKNSTSRANSAAAIMVMLCLSNRSAAA
jgi:hypothetical protein